MKRLMIAGTHSGCGKTTITCAVLQALVNRGYRTASFKCGPDYIDPMFHSRIIGTASCNLDRFFCSRDTVNYLLKKNAGEVSVIEGVMGFYDGVGHTASSHELAMDTETPVVLVIDCKGMGRSVGAVMQGFLRYSYPNGIAGFIFNRLPESMISEVKTMCAEMGVTYYGRFPKCDDAALKSRHLGLVTAEEVADLRQKMQKLATLAEEHLMLDALLSLADTAGHPPFEPPHIEENTSCGVSIAVARDRAFCFYYEENLSLLRHLGCEMVPFSPLNDKRLPDGVSGLLLGGGYPELYARQLSQNESMLTDIGKKIQAGLPTVAECGGFMYLHQAIQDSDGNCFQMVGAIDGTAFKTDRLQRFGYIHLTAGRDNPLCEKGETIAAHEFHYWDSTCCGEDFTARKASNGREYACIHAGRSLYAGFPHLYFYSNPAMAARFARRCRDYAEADHEKNQSNYPA